jgi:hypothetical protein
VSLPRCPQKGAVVPRRTGAQGYWKMGAPRRRGFARNWKVDNPDPTTRRPIRFWQRSGRNRAYGWARFWCGYFLCAQRACHKRLITSYSEQGDMFGGGWELDAYVVRGCGCDRPVDTSQCLRLLISEYQGPVLCALCLVLCALCSRGHENRFHFGT